MNIAKDYQKDAITGQIIYPCEMYQTPIETEENTEQNKEQQKEEN